VNNNLQYAEDLGQFVPNSYLCQCGGLMPVATRKDLITQKYVTWYVCPFCWTQRRASDVMQAETADQVLTQPASHP